MMKIRVKDQLKYFHWQELQKKWTKKGGKTLLGTIQEKSNMSFHTERTKLGKKLPWNVMGNLRTTQVWGGRWNLKASEGQQMKR